MKSKNAFALRGFDFDNFLQKQLAECGLSPNALKKFEADTNSFDEMQRARKAYTRLAEKLKNFRMKIVRHNGRLLKYQRAVYQLGIIDDDTYYFSIIKPRSKRTGELSAKYTDFARKLLEVEDTIKGIIYNLDQNQRGHYTKIFATRLREARKAAGLTQAELAAQIGMTQGGYTSYENFAREPSLGTLAILSKVLKCPIDWLLGLI